MKTADEIPLPEFRFRTEARGFAKTIPRSCFRLARSEQAALAGVLLVFLLLGALQAAGLR